MDTQARSAVKALVWTLIGILTTVIVAFVLTGSIAVGGALAVINAVLGTVMYVIYERIWDRIGWGRRGPEVA